MSTFINLVLQASQNNPENILFGFGGKTCDKNVRYIFVSLLLLFFANITTVKLRCTALICDKLFFVYFYNFRCLEIGHQTILWIAPLTCQRNTNEHSCKSVLSYLSENNLN